MNFKYKLYSYWIYLCNWLKSIKIFIIFFFKHLNKNYKNTLSYDIYKQFKQRYIATFNYFSYIFKGIIKFFVIGILEVIIIFLFIIFRKLYKKFIIIYRKVSKNFIIILFKCYSIFIKIYNIIYRKFQIYISFFYRKFVGLLMIELAYTIYIIVWMFALFNRRRESAYWAYKYTVLKESLFSHFLYDLYICVIEFFQNFYKNLLELGYIYIYKLDFYIVIFLIYIFIILILSLFYLFKNIKNYKLFIIYNNFIIFLYSVFLLFLYEQNYRSCFQFIEFFYWNNILNINYLFSFDSISLLFIILTTFLTCICILLSWNIIKYKIYFYFFNLLCLEFLLINVFLNLDLLFFYIFFESIIIPMFILISIWGSRNRKIHALYLFLLYTVIGSFFMLIALSYIYLTIGTTNYLYILKYINFNEQVQLYLWFAFFFAFSIKIPLIPVHIWLPEAHVEAPTSGSVFLAGILLKMGGYGIIRFLIPFFDYANFYFLPFIYSICVISIIYISWITVCQIDLKKIIAYSSIAHMSFVILGLFSYNLVGFEGSIFLMLSHGIVSSGLFICIGFLYDRYNTRLIKYYKGLVYFMPLYSIFFFLLILANISFPGTSSFVGEFLIFVGIFDKNIFLSIIISLSILLSTIYSIWMYNRIFFGNFQKNMFILKYSDLNKREFNILIILIVIIFFFGIYPKFCLNFLHNSCYFFLSFV